VFTHGLFEKHLTPADSRHIVGKARTCANTGHFSVLAKRDTNQTNHQPRSIATNIACPLLNQRRRDSLRLPEEPAVVVWSWDANTVHTACVPAPHDYSQHNQASPHALLNSLVLLTMCIMMPETCCELINQGNKHHKLYRSHPFVLSIQLVKYLFTSYTTININIHTIKCYKF